MKICKDGRIWGQNNKEAGEHLGVIAVQKEFARKGVKGNNNPMFGRKHSLESREKMSGRQWSIETRKKLSETHTGDKSPFWKGGISLLHIRIRHGIEFRLWREAVFARDNWTCQECGRRGGKLNSHHIKAFADYPELRFAIDNGKTLCLDCHKLTGNYTKRRMPKQDDNTL